MAGNERTRVQRQETLGASALALTTAVSGCSEDTDSEETPAETDAETAATDESIIKTIPRALVESRVREPLGRAVVRYSLAASSSIAARSLGEISSSSPARVAASAATVAGSTPASLATSRTLVARSDRA